MGIPPRPQRGGGSKKPRKKPVPPGRDGEKQGAAPTPRLEPAAAGYFRRAQETLRAGFESDQERDLFAANVLEEAEKAAVPLALDPSGSHLLQALLPLSSAPQLCRLLQALLPALRPVACHPCGAHILEAALLRAPTLLLQDEVEDAATLEELVLALGWAVREELAVFAGDAHGSFVVRSLLQLLGGARVGSDGARGGPGTGASSTKRKRDDAKNEGPVDFEVPDSFLSLLREFSESFKEQIAAFITNKLSSLCLQVALEVLHRKLPDGSAELCQSVIGYLSSRNPSAECSPLLVFLKDPTCSRVLDKVLEVLDPKALRSLYRAHFKGQLQVVAGHGVANFTLQRLIQAAPPKLLGKVFEELGPCLEAVLACGHMGVVTALLGACRKHRVHQQEVTQLLLEAFHCWEPAPRQEACVPLLASLLSYEMYYGLGEGEAETPSEQQAVGSRPLGPVSLHGSLLLQHLLHFTDPSPVLRSLAVLSPEDLIALAGSPVGSHVYDALLASPTAPEKLRRKVLRRLKGHYVSLACSKHGSRVLDAIWSRAVLPAKCEIAQELAEKEQQLRNDPFGHHLVRNFALTHFLKRRRDWERHQEAEKRRREMFAELLED